MSGNVALLYCRADEGKWKQVSRWMRESGDWDRRESVRTSGGWMEVMQGAGGRDREAEWEKQDWGGLCDTLIQPQQSLVCILQAQEQIMFVLATSDQNKDLNNKFHLNDLWPHKLWSASKFIWCSWTQKQKANTIKWLLFSDFMFRFTSSTQESQLCTRQ